MLVLDVALCQIEELPALRGRVRAGLAAYETTPGDDAAVALVLSELIANAFLHGKDPRRLRVSVSADANRDRRIGSRRRPPLQTRTVSWCRRWIWPQPRRQPHRGLGRDAQIVGQRGVGASTARRHDVGSFRCTGFTGIGKVDNLSLPLRQEYRYAADLTASYGEGRE